MYINNESSIIDCFYFAHTIVSSLSALKYIIYQSVLSSKLYLSIQ